MAVNVSREITALRKLTVPELRQRYAEAFGESTMSRHKEYLVRRIVWRLQANQEGDISERARQWARELAGNSDVRLTAPKSPTAPTGPATVATIQISQDDRLPMPGAIITRRFKGQAIEVRVLPHGFEHDGEVYRSLSAIAKKVTGTHWNGFHFFRIGTKGAANGRETL